MSKKKYISVSCVIDDHIIYRNGKPVFRDMNKNISAFLDETYKHFNMKYPKFYKMDNLSKLGLLATEILLKDGFKKENYKPEEIGIVLTNASASLDTDIKYNKTTEAIPSPALFVYTLPNIVIGEICIKNNFKGENAFFVFKEFDATFIAGYVNQLFDSGLVKACICGWIELLDESYKSVMLLVEWIATDESLIFTQENIKKIYSIENG